MEFYIKTQRFSGVDIEGIKNSDVSFVLDVKVNTPVLSFRFFLILFCWVIAVHEILDVGVDICWDPSTTGGIEFHSFDEIFIVDNSYPDFFAGDGAIDFVGKGLLEWSWSQSFPKIGNESEGNGEYLMRVEDDLGFVLLHAS